MKFRAWDNRVLGAYLAHRTLLDAEAHPTDQYKRLRATCAWALADWHWCGETYKRILTPDEAQRMWVAGRTFLITYNALARIAVDKHLPKYHITYKFHYFDHMHRDVVELMLNPKYCHCFADEDMVGSIAKVCKATHRATHAVRTLMRYRAMLIQKLYKFKKRPTLRR